MKNFSVLSRTKIGKCEISSTIVPHGNYGNDEYKDGMRLEKLVTSYGHFTYFNFGKRKAMRLSLLKRIKALLFIIMKRVMYFTSYKIRVAYVSGMLEIMLGLKQYVCFNCEMAHCRGLYAVKTDKGFVYVSDEIFFNREENEIKVVAGG